MCDVPSSPAPHKYICDGWDWVVFISIAYSFYIRIDSQINERI